MFAGNAAHAQVVDDRPIVVTGKKGGSAKAAQRQLRQIVSAVDGQLARFAEPVCPIVLGLSPESSLAVARRMRDIAEDAGAKVAPERCDPNIVIIIAADADMFTAALRKRFPAMFAGLRPGELRRAKREGPVHAWNTVEVRNEDGEAATGGDGEEPPVLAVQSASNIRPPTQQVTLQSIVVIDDGAALGKSLTQIADYAAMRTLAGARPPREPGMAETILSLFDADGVPPPQMLTRLDSGFIKELYSGAGNATARQKARAAARRVAGER
ncbi:hypothetical protein [Sphingomonas soli]|uniref:hypothetical protein n=1 Tax=Sphingomonas soli TaxID=266127 RepID=UPI0008351601|nr:hypothetical protein [Sphingomonas soli]